MTAAGYQEALYSYSDPLHEFSVESMPAGLIHRTYRVRSKNTANEFLLQQINHEVFPDPRGLQKNYDLIWKYLVETGSSFRIPSPGYFPDAGSLFEDSNGNFWRVNEFVGGSTTFQTAASPELAAKVATVFAKFTSELSGFDHHQLTVTIPGFHDPALRFRQLLDAEKNKNILHDILSAGLLHEMKKRERYVHFYELLIQSPAFLQRVMHHDAKISNVLFDASNGELICLVDLDTAMPGYIFSDLGDMIRSMVGDRGEHDTGVSDLRIREDYYEAILGTYTGILRDKLTDTEKKHIHFSGILITYLQALRYLTDHFNGNIYYQCTYPTQNLDRARMQFVLLEQLEKFLDKKYGFRV